MYILHLREYCDDFNFYGENYTYLHALVEYVNLKILQ